MEPEVLAGKLKKIRDNSSIAPEEKTILSMAMDTLIAVQDFRDVVEENIKGANLSPLNQKAIVKALKEFDSELKEAANAEQPA